MFRVMKWSVPCVAFALLLGLAASARAEEAKKETGAVSGTVLDKDGSPAPGVQVRLFHPFERGQRPGGGAAAKTEKQNADPAAPADGEKKPGKGGKGPKGDRPKAVATTSTDKDGKFNIADVPVGKYVVMTMVKGVGGAREEVEVTAGGEAKVELKLKERPAAKGGQKKGAKQGDASAE
jgi:5-hydroxyisourate hydrolase-like protein (transthyretin family)